MYREDNETTRRHGEMEWANRLRWALEQDRFLLDYQQIVPLDGRDTATSIELLLRLRDEEGGIVLPGAFLPAAERYGLMPVSYTHLDVYKRQPRDGGGARWQRSSATHPRQWNPTRPTAHGQDNTAAARARPLLLLRAAGLDRRQRIQRLGQRLRRQAGQRMQAGAQQFALLRRTLHLQRTALQLSLIHI